MTRLLLLHMLENLPQRQVSPFAPPILPLTRYVAFVIVAVVAPKAVRHDVLLVNVVRGVARECVLEL